jgi:hypothetical protein
VSRDAGARRSRRSSTDRDAQPMIGYVREDADLFRWHT